MNHLEAVDAKLERARGQLRRLRDDAGEFCRERSRLILPEECGPEECGEGRRWVYRGGESVLPLGWSIRVGEWAYNLRSALDQLVWQLAAAYGRCAGGHGDGECPGRHSEFPIRVRRDPGRLDVRLCGVGPAARAYIESVQPPRRPGRPSASGGNRVGLGLGMLRDICNRDKHQTPLRASVGWTGEWPRVPGGEALPRAPRAGGQIGPGPRTGGAVRSVGRELSMTELRYGQALLITWGGSDGRGLEFPLEFPVEAWFDDLPHWRSGGRQGAPVGETLDACMDSVELVVSRLRREL